jgi:hypothetical protein
MTETHPPSWLPDPFGRYQYRYWDGAVWTDLVSTNGTQESDPHGIGPSTGAALAAPLAGSSGAPRPKPAWTTQLQVMVIGGAGLIAIGAILPWVKAEAGVFSITKNGTEGDGVLTFVAAVAIALVFLLGRRQKTVAWWVIVLSGFVLAVGLYDTVDISNKADELANDSSSLVHVSATVGLGLWITLVAGVVALVGGVMALNHSPAERTAVD